MKALKVVWGLLVDDARLAIGTLVSLVVLALLSIGLHAGAVAGWVFFLLLLVSLTVSLRREVLKRLKS